MWNVTPSSVLFCPVKTRCLSLSSAALNAQVGLLKELWHNPRPSCLWHLACVMCHPQMLPGSLQVWGLRSDPAGIMEVFISRERPSPNMTCSPPDRATSVSCVHAQWVTHDLLLWRLPLYGMTLNGWMILGVIKKKEKFLNQQRLNSKAFFPSSNLLPRFGRFDKIWWWQFVFLFRGQTVLKLPYSHPFQAKKTNKIQSKICAWF